MKRSLDGPAKKAARVSKKAKSAKEWSVEEDVYLKELACKEEIINWGTVCRKFNKKFTTSKRTSKACESRWTILSSTPTLNEELMITLTLYRNNLELAASILKDKLDVHDYLSNLIGKLKTTADTKDSSHLPLLTKLQFFVLIDLALGEETGDAQVQGLRTSKNDWLEVAQALKNDKEKMTREEFHEFVEGVVESMEDKVGLLLEQSADSIKDIMHERRENLSQGNAHQDFSGMNPAMRMNLYILASYYRHQQS
eukprot:TRINITY_DN8047_c0_g1_i5.p1 TRINITY_DN8047_c0_g1~~TRINITY_DN8047_c0_g1_i5.p1  ORF type:complete len:254 (-),score=81.13 TRINITY_DN8047_c0_g1_i5:173-934(-)